MKVNGREYGYKVEPFFNKISAEVYKVSKHPDSKGNPVHLFMIRKEFGGLFRGPNNGDYDKAKEWAQNHLDQIRKNNESI